jgi:uncharacterized protein (DUF1697 family)
MPTRATTNRVEAVRYVALLRGINVGGHRVAMADLRAHIEALNLRDVKTFIASGNVIFDAPASVTPAALEQRIEAHLLNVLGYAVPTFVRTPAELARTAQHRPFAAADTDPPAHTVHVGFLRETPPLTLERDLQARHTAKDAFAIRDRELFWLIRGKTMDSLVTWQKLEKALGLQVTMRNITSLRKLVATLAS